MSPVSLPSVSRVKWQYRVCGSSHWELLRVLSLSQSASSSKGWQHDPLRAVTLALLCWRGALGAGTYRVLSAGGGPDASTQRCVANCLGLHPQGGTQSWPCCPCVWVLLPFFTRAVGGQRVSSSRSPWGAGRCVLPPSSPLSAENGSAGCWAQAAWCNLV